MSIVDFIFNNKEYFEDYITRSTFHSNSIEGNTLSLVETYAIIFNDNSFTISAQPRELYEAINHKYALNYVLNNIGAASLSELMIKHIAVIINKNINDIDGYRTTSVFIRGAEHIPPLPNQINQLMMYFTHNYNTVTFDSVFEKVAFHHIEFEKIHPFSDGNGRTGRLLIAYELLKNNLPPAVITKEDRADYFEFIAKSDVQGMAELIKNKSVFEKERMNKFKTEL